MNVVAELLNQAKLLFEQCFSHMIMLLLIKCEKSVYHLQLDNSTLEKKNLKITYSRIWKCDQPGKVNQSYKIFCKLLCNNCNFFCPR